MNFIQILFCKDKINKMTKVEEEIEYEKRLQNRVLLLKDFIENKNFLKNGIDE